MRGRFRIGLTIAMCVVVFGAFLAHKPACSESRMLHNKPVPSFRALTADIDLKAAIGAAAQVATLDSVLALASHMQYPLTQTSPPLEVSSPQALFTCLLC